MANQLNSPWSEEKVSKMLELLKNGKTGGEVGRALGITRNAVIGKIHRLGYKLGVINGNSRDLLPKPEVLSKTHRERPRLNSTETNVLDAFMKRRPEIKYTRFRYGKTKASEPVPVIEIAERQPHNCTLMELRGRVCHWPLWNDDVAEKLYCGAPVAGKTYCAGHWRMAIRPHNH
jgi:GcrA cell cycle regulator